MYGLNYVKLVNKVKHGIRPTFASRFTLRSGEVGGEGWDGMGGWCACTDERFLLIWFTICAWFDQVFKKDKMICNKYVEIRQIGQAGRNILLKPLSMFYSMNSQSSHPPSLHHQPFYMTMSNTGTCAQKIGVRKMRKICKNVNLLVRDHSYVKSMQHSYRLSIDIFPYIIVNWLVSQLLSSLFLSLFVSLTFCLTHALDL